MGNKVLWLAGAFMLMFEGLLPLLLPRQWRQMVEKILQMPEPHIRIYGAVAVISGVLLYWAIMAVYG